MAKTKLNIFLAKEGKQIEDVIKEIDPNPIRRELEEGVFYYKRVDDKKPNWIESFFKDEVEDDELRNKTIQAVYVTEVPIGDGITRVFAITFGLGRNLLKLDNFEERFGIITAMNLINEETLRSIDINSIDGNPKSHRIQVGKLGSLKDFELDSVYDILKNINGRVDDQRIVDAKSIGGRQSLSISLTSDSTQIRDVLIQLYTEYQSVSYKEKFPGIDQTREITDKQQIEALDSLLIDIIKNPDRYPASTVGLAFPEIIEDTEIFTINYSKSEEYFDEIELEQMKLEISNKFGEEYGIGVLKRERIWLRNTDGIVIKSWKIYRCIIGDVRDNGHQYVLNDGKWYVYEDDYAQQINEFYENAQLSQIDLIDCALNKTEDVYNEDACRALASAIHWDRELLNPFKNSRFELCDIFDLTSRSFIHIKKKRGSEALSHLFLQGSVSGDMMTNKVVRRAAIDMKREMAECIDEDNFNASSYNIVYGIIEKNNDDFDRPNIPFFSKVSFRQIASTLANIGYTVQLKSIKWRN